MIPLVKAVAIAPAGAFRLYFSFSDGTEGEHDFAPLIHEGGPMLAPLADPSFFARAFLEHGAPTWPNGFDLDAIALHRAMEAAGELRHVDAA